MAEEKWIPNKFESEEEKCINLFKEFAKLKPLRKYFKITGATDYGALCDTINENKTGGTVAVELKYRFFKSTSFEDCYIEPAKYDNLMKLYDKGCLPLYLNFIGNKYYLWVLPEIDKSNITIHKNVAIKSAISGYKHVDRYGLKWQDAWIFDKAGNIIQESASKDNKPVPPRKHNIDFSKPINNDVLNNLK